jgi:hypothetical protein
MRNVRPPLFKPPEVLTKFRLFVRLLPFPAGLPSTTQSEKSLRAVHRSCVAHLPHVSVVVPLRAKTQLIHNCDSPGGAAGRYSMA